MSEPTLHLFLSLAFTPGLGPRKIKLLLEHFGAADALSKADAPALMEVEGVGRKLAQAVVAARPESTRKADEELRRAEKLNVEIISVADRGYPESLRHIYDPPPVLYVRGALPQGVRGELLELRSLGVVGTRNASPYALELSRGFSQTLAGMGVAVVSGLAFGIDTAAHEGALEAPDGRTVAVLGSGVDIIYPGQNRGLAQRIVEGGGAVVSEYRLGTQPRAEYFPGRNRIINGLSRGVLVVEGGARSGALGRAHHRRLRARGGPHDLRGAGARRRSARGGRARAAQAGRGVDRER